MVRSVLRLVYKEVRGLHQAAYVLALFAFTSQLLALVRDRLLAHQFGAGIELDIYYAAFRIPDLLFVLFASSLSVYVLIPFVTERVTGHSSEKAQELLSQVATVFLVFYSTLAVIVFFGAPFLVTLIAPGLIEQADEVAAVMRVLLLQPLLLGLSSLCGVVTQIGHRFVLYALSPLLYNIGIIIGIVALYPQLGLLGLALGVVLGALGHLLVQVPLVRSSDFAFFVTRTINWSEMYSILRVSVPRALTLASQQLAFVAFVALASLMAVGSVAVFQFAYNLQSVPLAIVGASYSVAAFPMLAHYYAERQMNAFRQHVLSAMRHIIFWAVPIIALIVVLRAQIVRVVLGSGAFDWSDTRLTAAVLALFCISLFAQALNLLIIRTFYAAGETKIPFFTTLLSSVVSISVTSWLYFSGATASDWFTSLAGTFRISGVNGAEVLLLALGFVIMAFLQTTILIIYAAKLYKLPLSWLPLHFGRSLAAAIVGGVMAYGTINFIVEGINQDVFIGIFMQGLVGGVVGVSGVVATYFILRSPELLEITRSFRSRIFKTDVIASQEDVL